MLQQQEIALRPKAFETLLYLVQHAGRLVKKEELLEKIWSGSFVSETTLTHCIEEIRTALLDDAHNPRYIKTVHRLGYKFIDEVIELPFASSPAHSKGAGSSAPALFAALRQHRLAVLTLPALLGLVILWCSIRPRVSAIDSLAVLPFLNLSGDTSKEYIVDGMTDALITRLAGLKGTRIISRTSVMQYKSTKKPLPAIGHELGVDAVIEGSVYQDSSRIRVTVQLVKIHNESHLWAETYERPLDELWTFQNDLAQAIAHAISNKLLPEQTLSKVEPGEPRAYEAYLKGRYFFEKRNEEGFIKALEYYRQALSLQPQFAPALAGVADYYNMLANYDLLPPDQAAPLARTAASQALALNANLAEAHAALGFTAAFYDWNWQQAEASLQQAVAINASNADAHHWLALLYVITNRYAQAQQEIKTAQLLDPLSLIINTNDGWICYFQRRNDLAKEKLQNVLEMDSVFVSALIKMGWVLQQCGEARQALVLFDRVRSILQNDISAKAWYGHALALAGERQMSNRMLQEIIASAQNRYVPAYPIACIHAALSDNEAAWNWLEKAYAQRSNWLAWFAHDPKMDALRSDPRFELLARRIAERHEEGK
ncbi:MAG TPA: winged helix-turn-helix domain-containing protein [bacterium]|nr:winged helix-turn-helix domain-containing protein [bacterium]HPN34573.1 winged helix-turn-helix domain-containing protein [bacterium]